MTAKEYLKQITRLEKSINLKREKIITLEAIATNCSPNLSGMPHNPHKSASPMADAICKKIDLEKEIAYDIALLDKKKVFMLELIGRLENEDMQMVLIKRYFDYWSWSKICEFNYFSPSWTYELHKLGLIALNDLFSTADNIP